AHPPRVPHRAYGRIAERVEPQPRVALEEVIGVDLPLVIELEGSAARLALLRPAGIVARDELGARAEATRPVVAHRLLPHLTERVLDDHGRRFMASITSPALLVALEREAT